MTLSLAVAKMIGDVTTERRSMRRAWFAVVAGDAARVQRLAARLETVWQSVVTQNRRIQVFADARPPVDPRPRQTDELAVPDRRDDAEF